MAQTPNISFIPKKPLAQGYERQSRPVSLLLIISIVVLVLVGATYGGIYVYNNSYLAGQIDQKKTTLENDNAAYQADLTSSTGTVAQARAIAAQLGVVKNLVGNHVVISPLLDYIARIIPQNSYLSAFTISKSTSASKLSSGYDVSAGDYVVHLQGRSLDFSTAIALRDAFEAATDEFKSVAYSGTSIDGPMAHIEFTIDAVLQPSVIQYATLYGSGQNKASTTAAVISTSTATTTKQ